MTLFMALFVSCSKDSEDNTERLFVNFIEIEF